MSNSSFRSTLDTVKGNLYKAQSNERNYWDNATQQARESILGTDIASEFAYQQDYTARFNQLVNTNYDSLPESVKATITEALITQGELPNPSDYKGIGLEFIANDYGTEREVFIECDRCDESFMDETDFGLHKTIDHGDESVREEEIEAYEFSMNPDINREAWREARRSLAEADQGDLYRKTTFNYKEIKTPTLNEPKVDGKTGYNDNPNEGLYDTKKFKIGTSKDRYALEADIGADSDDDATYDPSQSMSDITNVGAEPINDPASSLEGIDFSEEAVDFDYYPTIPESATEGKTSMLSDVIAKINKEYGGDIKESDEEAVEALIIERKLHGYSVENIANELVIQYDVTPESAIEKINSVEVSGNDKLSFTFFNKKFNECTEAEIDELRLYSGSDEE